MSKSGKQDNERPDPASKAGPRKTRVRRGAYEPFLFRSESEGERTNRHIAGSVGSFSPRVEKAQAARRDAAVDAREAYELTKAVNEKLAPEHIIAVARILREQGMLFSEVAAFVVVLLEKECEDRLRLSVEELGPSVTNQSAEHVNVNFDAGGRPTISVKIDDERAAPTVRRLEQAVEGFFVGGNLAKDEEDFFLLASEWLWTHVYLWTVGEFPGELERKAMFAAGVENFADLMGSQLAQNSYRYLVDLNGEPLKILVRELARDYVRSLRLEQMGLRDIEALLGLETGREYETAPKPRSRGDHLTVFSPLAFQRLREVIVRGDSFEQVEGSPWPVASLGEEGAARGQAMLRPPVVDEQILMPPEAVEAWAKEMWRQRGELSDLDADALDALSAVWLWQARDPRDGAVTGVDDLLEMRGIKKKRGGGGGRRGGYEPEQRADMLRALHHIQNIWLEMDGVEVYEGRGRRRKPVRKSVQSRAFVITDRMGQMRLDGHMDVERFRFVPGEIFARFLISAGRQVALLSAQALRYDPYRQKWEKRLARYLSWQWRTRAKSGEYLQPYRVETLLERAGESLNPRRPSQTKERLEKALDTLQRDGVIAGWQYDSFEEWWEKVRSRRKGWAPVWLSATVVIEPPETIKDGYRRGLGKFVASGKAPKPLGETTLSGEAIREKRKELGLSQLRAAEQLGITQSRLSRIENGKTVPSGELKAKLERWLRDR